MSATAFDEPLTPIPSRPNSIAHLVKRHIKLIMIHTVSKRSSDDAIQELNVSCAPNVTASLQSFSRAAT